VHNNNRSRQESITDIITQIEYMEIVKIYGSNILKDNPSKQFS
jgi:hypothetical protein